MANGTQLYVDLLARDRTRAGFNNVKKRSNALVAHVAGVSRQIRSMGRSLQDAIGLVPARGVAGITAAMGFFGKAVFQTQMQFDSFRNSLRVGKGSLMAAEVEILRMQKTR